MRVQYRAKALADIDRIECYLESLDVDGARSVVRGIYDSIRAIAEVPYASQQTNDSELRVKIVRRYRYKIFFRIVDADSIRIIHVRHTSRQPWPHN